VFGLLSLQSTSWLVGVLTLEVIANTALNGPLSRVLGVRGVALATAVAMIASNAVLWTLFLRRIGGFPRRAVWSRAWRTAAVCGVAGGALAAGHALVWRAFDVRGVLPVLTALLLLGIAYLAAYLALSDVAGLARVRFVGIKPVVRFAPGSDDGAGERGQWGASP
jgi:peptidoglycan biosynthesis protein MviN/MurJ (putative lipid II flippase)